jgi:hypothetical protein
MAPTCARNSLQEVLKARIVVVWQLEDRRWPNIFCATTPTDIRSVKVVIYADVSFQGQRELIMFELYCTATQSNS